MKRIIFNLYICASLFVGFSCNSEIPTEESDIQLEGIIAELGERSTDNTVTRAVGDFAVNTAADPTRESTRITGGYNWTLSVNILDKNNANYPPGNAICTYNGSTWIPQSPLFFSSYKSPHVIANLYPPGWVLGTSTIAPDQSDATKLLNQDVLVQNGSPYIIRPTHTPTIVLRHGHSMLNFILSDVNSAQITSVDVVAGGITYQPYPVAGRPSPEYMVILPVGTANPVVRVTTAAGARYQEAIRIPSTTTAINTCYCVKLIGVELVLSSVTVIDWVYGTALEGSYTTITSYPTFRGNPNTTITVNYLNGQEQQLVFNQNGEATGIKPLGRTIVRINSTDLATPVILDRMYVDLRAYL